MDCNQPYIMWDLVFHSLTMGIYAGKFLRTEEHEFPVWKDLPNTQQNKM